MRLYGLWKQNMLQTRSNHQKKLVQRYHLKHLQFWHILEIFVISKEDASTVMDQCSAVMVSQNLSRLRTRRAFMYLGNEVSVDVMNHATKSAKRPTNWAKAHSLPTTTLHQRCKIGFKSGPHLLAFLKLLYSFACFATEFWLIAEWLNTSTEVSGCC